MFDLISFSNQSYWAFLLQFPLVSYLSISISIERGCIKTIEKYNGFHRNVFFYGERRAKKKRASCKRKTVSEPFDLRFEKAKIPSISFDIFIWFLKDFCWFFKRFSFDKFITSYECAALIYLSELALSSWEVDGKTDLYCVKRNLC